MLSYFRISIFKRFQSVWEKSLVFSFCFVILSTWCSLMFTSHSYLRFIIHLLPFESLSTIYPMFVVSFMPTPDDVSFDILQTLFPVLSHYIYLFFICKLIESVASHINQPQTHKISLDNISFQSNSAFPTVLVCVCMFPSNMVVIARREVLTCISLRPVLCLESSFLKMVPWKFN